MLVVNAPPVSLLLPGVQSPSRTMTSISLVDRSSLIVYSNVASSPLVMISRGSICVNASRLPLDTGENVPVGVGLDTGLETGVFVGFPGVGPGGVGLGAGLVTGTETGALVGSFLGNLVGVSGVGLPGVGPGGVGVGPGLLGVGGVGVDPVVSLSCKSNSEYS